jgi:hypothetical protein
MNCNDLLTQLQSNEVALYAIRDAILATASSGGGGGDVYIGAVYYTLDEGIPTYPTGLYTLTEVGSYGTEEQSIRCLAANYIFDAFAMFYDYVIENLPALLAIGLIATALSTAIAGLLGAGVAVLATAGLSLSVSEATLLAVSELIVAWVVSELADLVEVEDWELYRDDFVQAALCPETWEAQQSSLVAWLGNQLGTLGHIVWRMFGGEWLSGLLNSGDGDFTYELSQYVIGHSYTCQACSQSDFDFTVSQHGWALSQDAGGVESWVSGVGFQDVTSYNTRYSLKITDIEARTFDTITVHNVQSTVGINQPTVVIYSSSNGADFIEIARRTNNDVVPVFTFTGLSQTSKYIRVELTDTGAFGGFTAVLSRVTLS